MWDNSNMQEDCEWGNIPVGNMTDQELYKKNWTKSRTDNNGMLKPSSKEKHQKSISNRDSVWLKNVSEANKKKEKDPNFRNKRQTAIEKRSNSSDWIEKQKSNAKKKRKPVWTRNDGIFESRRAAADYYKCANSWISVLIKKHPDDYRYISQEEYDSLTKK
jgi:hypothetical protein